ncbi:MAG: class I SAM-dependent DNA methyltransferase [Prevotella sp.]|nr:class I SAM-dependent DNA methyltransferase [Prevotella sp.]
MKTEKQQAMAAEAFAQRWQGRGYEKGDSQLYWTELLTEVFGIENPSTFIKYEEQVKVDKTNFIDGHIPSTRVLIEQKSLDKDLRKGIVQSDGTVLNPFQQAKRYVANMPLSEHPRWIVTCNFKEFLVYDMEQPNGEPEHILLENLGKEYYRLQFLVDVKSEHLSKEMEVSMKAGEMVGKIYEKLLEQYIDPTNAHSLKSLNILCVRLVFCLYCEDSGVFGKRDMFHDYLVKYDAENTRAALIRLFKVLNTPLEERDPYLMESLAVFPYVSGGLFEEENIEIPRFTDEIRHILLQNASLDFDWSEISPTIFGAVFESTLNPDTRRSGGMHYTSVENIHKVIDPLFLDELRTELDTILEEEKVPRQRKKRLEAYQERLASLTFLDPACGSGNFLTETYLSLRRLENRAIMEETYGQTMLGDFIADPIRVNIRQFYGIEINDFAVVVAKTALWISEAQMMHETEKIIHKDLEFLPLRNYANIHEANALRIDWNDVVPKEQLDYIMGNPPFVGARLMDAQQKQDVIHIFGEKYKNVGNMDYVCCWYKKAWQMIKGTSSHAALVSTNSISQGEQVANLWQPLMEDGLRIDFAYRTFRWDSEASLKAHVHCIIVGFSEDDFKTEEHLLFDKDKMTKVSHINGYLMDAPDVFIGSRQHPLADVPEIGIGNKPIDGGNYLFTRDEMLEFIQIEPKSEQYFKPWYGSVEFIHQQPRYCLWLGNCSPAELRQMPHCMKRIEAVRDTRLASTSAGTRKLADRPTRFHVENMPKGNYIIVPSVSSEKRRYIPMGFMSPDVLASNLVLLIPEATLYHFGILESNVHMAWMRAVCGRLKSDYRYSKDVVYNNFPWPTPTDEQRAKIEQTAQQILDARALYPDSSLADLYDELTMPVELRRAHQHNDRAVMEAYGFPIKNDFTESRCVAELFKMYQELTTK